MISSQSGITPIPPEPGKPMVTVIVPCFNEEKHIGKLIGAILAQDYPANLLEILIIDGDSTDATRSIIASWSERFPAVRMLHNPDRYVPQALNLGIVESKGDIVVRMDAHSDYPANYISRLTEELLRLGADNTGGVWIIRPSLDTRLARAIALAQSSVFGVGAARYRTGADKPVPVDTVPYGCFPRDLFDRIGLFDTDLIRNQDDEFNARIRKHGGSVYLVPDVKIQYYARSGVRSLWRMFYQYGLFKPLVNRKLKRPNTVRQFIPPLFVVSFAGGGLLSLAFPPVLLPWLALVALYVTAAAWFTSKAILKEHHLYPLLYLPWLFPVQHFAYGTGFLSGILRFIMLRRSKKQVASSR